jgi:glutamate formiminotransferase
VLEAVPNVSEGRDAALISAIGDAFAKDVPLLDVHADPDHHRSVFTIAGHEESLVESLLAGIAVAVELIDLREHDGVHPRIGAVDVVPLVPLEPTGIDSAALAARTLAQRIGTELGLPVFLYGEVGAGRRPAFFRSGGLDELRRRVAVGELAPDEGPRRIDPRSGAVLVGARHALVAYNLDLATGDVAVAMAIAAAVRESSGGMPGVQAIGLQLSGSGRLQVSMNVIDLERAPVHEVVERVRREAAAHGVDVAAGELVGLVPARVLEAAVAAGVELPGIDESRVLERVLGSRLAEWRERSS